MSTQSVSASSRPNIVFAIADDASHFGAYGHSFVQTPNFDRVCANGVRFTSAFTTNPKCAPSRASILTGRHTWRNRESCLHWNHWPSDLAVYPDALDAAGYHVGYTGKPWAPGDWHRSGRRQNPVGRAYNDETLSPPAGTAISSCDYAANFGRFLEARPDGAPFCFWYGGHEPHRPYRYGEGAAHGKRPDEVAEVPPYWPDEESIRRDITDYAYEIEWFDLHLGRILDRLEAAGELENTLVVVTSDNGAPFPRVKGQMYDDDFRLPLAAMWHARVTGGRVIDDVVSFVDFAPTFLEVAGIERSGDAHSGSDLGSDLDIDGRSLTDVLFCAESGTVTDYRTRAYMGRERHDMGREGDLGYPVRCVRTPTHLYMRNFAPDRWPAGNPETGFTNCDSSPTKSRIIELNERGVTSYYDLAFGKRPLEELYDVVADPHCMTNLAADPAYAPLKAQLWEELRSVLVETGDPRIKGHGDVFEGYEYIVDAPHSWAHYLAGDWKPQAY